MRSIVPSVEKPRVSARRAHLVICPAVAPGTAFGSATPTSISAVALADDRPQLGAIVARMDAAHRAGTGAHHQRFGSGPRTAVANALQDVAVGDAAGGEEDVVTGAEVVGCEDTVEVITRVDRRAALLVVARPE